MRRFFSRALQRIGCGWAWTLMAAVAEDSITDDEMNESMRSHVAPSDEESRHVPEKLKLWMTQHATRLGTSTSSGRGMTFLWFMTWSCNRVMLTKYMTIALAYIFFRGASQFFYSMFINALGDSWPDFLDTFLHDKNGNQKKGLIKTAVVATAFLFSGISILSAYLSFKLDKRGKSLITHGL